jgi:hypothetical protein
VATPLSAPGGTQRALAPEPTQVSLAPQAGLQGLTQVPLGEHSVPARHSGKHLGPMTAGSSSLHPPSVQAARIHAYAHRDRCRAFIASIGYHGGVAAVIGAFC